MDYQYSTKIFFINVPYLHMKSKAHMMSEITILPEFILFDQGAVCLSKQEGKEVFESMKFRRVCKILHDLHVGPLPEPSSF